MIESLDRTGTYRTYSIADGLNGMRIEHIAEDGEGCIWFATWDNGVSRFDGNEFRRFTERDGLCSDRTFYVLKDSRNRLWFGTAHGVCWYDGSDFHCLEGDGITARSTQCIYEDDEGRVWFAGGGGTLGYYDGTAFHDMIPLYRQYCKRDPALDSVTPCWGIAQDGQGHLWFGLNALIRFDGTAFHHHDEKEGFPLDETAYVLDSDHTGKVWIGRFEIQDKIWCYTDGAFQTVQVALGGQLRKIQCDGTGRIWLSTTSGILYQDGDGFSRFPLPNGLPHSGVKAVYRDRDLQYWFATWCGVVRYDAHSISIFDLEMDSREDKEPSEISQIVQDRRGDIWVGCVSPILNSSAKNVGRFDGECFAILGAGQGFDVDNCLSIYEDHEGYLWFGGGNGLFRYDGRKLNKEKMATSSGEGTVSTIVQDAQGRFLFGIWDRGTFESGVLKAELKTSPLKIIYQQDEQYRTIFVEDEKYDVLDRIGSVVTGRSGEVYFHLSCYSSSHGDRGLARWHPDEGLRFYGVEDGLVDEGVTDISSSRDGSLWIATRNGLSRFDGSEFRNFTTEDGLPSNYIRCLFEDARGHLWLGTDGGVIHYNGRHFQTIRSPHIGPVCRIIEDRDGAFWFGTTLGTVIRYRQRRNPPRVRLLQVAADRNYVDLKDGVATTTDQQVTFEYKGLSLTTHPGDMLYTCRLKGHDSGWQPATQSMRAHYRDLPPGNYTFQVRAVDRDLNYSKISKVELSIKSDPRIEAFTDVINRQGSEKFIGRSAALHVFQVNLKKVSSTDMNVLILGETGVGKGLAARLLHSLSAHCDGPFIEASCGALPGTLIDSELFGHEKGAFTSAVSHRMGRVELAKGGTLFLDEIGDMSLDTQVKLLRLLEEGRFERIGGSKTLTAETRVVAATNRDLKEMVSTGAFREDLYYRLYSFPIHLPALRERKEDIPELAEYFKDRLARHIGRQIAPLTREVIEVLQSYEWPGNVRELMHVVQQAVVLSLDSQIEVEDLRLQHDRFEDALEVHNGRPLGDLNGHSVDHGEVVHLDEFERRYILGVLEASNWTIKGPRGAAKLLGLPPSTLYNKMKKLGISKTNTA